MFSQEYKRELSALGPDEAQMDRLLAAVRPASATA